MLVWLYNVIHPEAVVATITERSWKKQSGAKSIRYRVAFTDAGGVRKKRDFAKKVDAKRFVEGLSALKTLAGEGYVVPSPKTEKSSMTFSAAADDYLEARRTGRDGGDPLEKATIEFYGSGLANAVLPVLGSKSLAEITPADMRSFRDSISGMDRSRRTKRHYLFMAGAVLGHALDNDWITVDPSANVKLARSRRIDAPAANRVAMHSREEMSTLLRVVDEIAESMTDPRRKRTCTTFAHMLHTLAFSGLRISEARGLPCDAVDAQAGTIKVYQRADRYTEIGQPKSAHSYRTIDIPRTLAKRLEGWIGDRTGLVFPTKSGKPDLLTNIIRRHWHPLQAEAGVTKLNIHCVRHFYASMLIHQGAKMKMLQEVMGHHDPMFTLRVYGHLFTDAEDVALRQSMAARMQASLMGDEADEES